MKNEGIIVAVNNNLATIKINDNFFQAQIRGNLKKSTQLLVGDKVIFSQTVEKEIVIEKVLERKNKLYRPKIANIDQVFIVNALKMPNFNTVMLNKLLTLFNFYQIEVKLIFTKTDLINQNDDIWQKVNYYQDLNYESFFISNTNHNGDFEKIINKLRNKLSLLTGLSGVGKSSLLNNLDKKLNLATNEFSQVLKHGKHTTTTTKLYFLYDGIIADSPGFLILKLLGLQETDIANNFPLIKNYINKCKFRNCLHQNEPECGVINNLNSDLNKFFYQDYLKILNEFISINNKLKLKEQN